MINNAVGGHMAARNAEPIAVATVFAGSIVFLGIAAFNLKRS
jgi:hypothetical protein